jgi:hypothetical protein
MTKVSRVVSLDFLPANNECQATRKECSWWSCQYLLKGALKHNDYTLSGIRSEINNWRTLVGRVGRGGKLGYQFLILPFILPLAIA